MFRNSYPKNERILYKESQPMCIAIPMRLINIEGTTGLVETDGISRMVNLILIDNPAVGDYLIVHAGCAINRIDEEVALETIETLKSLYDLQK